ncbi:hypothetical protein COCNU_03G002610 [Cocos nucifera]|uniref:Uncharacterized protein n=1 Tax=Cocos nucifera TaxID=13894 RepID=A0A8K0I1I9_COCNU|nr:hypothetical protein COCNU_03G002610 [Cocos nucifera]
MICPGRRGNGWRTGTLLLWVVSFLRRMPLSVAKTAMKNRKRREQKKIEEGLILGPFAESAAKNKDKSLKLKLEDSVEGK